MKTLQSAKTMVIFAMLWCSISVRAEPVVTILLTENSSLYHGVASAIIEQHEDIETSFKVLDLNELTVASGRKEFLQGSEYIVAVGYGATRYLAKAGYREKVLSTFVTRESFRLVTERYPEVAGDYSAIYLDQPVERQFSLAIAISPQLESLGTILPENAASVVEELSDAATSCNIRLEYDEIADTDNPIAVIEKVFSKSDVFLILPHDREFMRKTAKWVLYISASRRKPVIGFSRKYTRAGALIAMFSSPEDAGMETGELLQQWLSGRSAFKTVRRHGELFHLVINQKVARSLGYHTLDVATLKQTMALIEGKYEQATNNSPCGF